MNGTRHGQQASSASFPDSFTFSEDADAEDVLTSDYSARLEELMNDDEDENKDVPTRSPHDEEAADDDQGFHYTGVDSQPSGTYREQLRDVLGADAEDDELEEQEVESSLIRSVHEKEIYEAAMDDEARVCTVMRINNMWSTEVHIASGGFVSAV
jgi:hypothetical protein